MEPNQGRQEETHHPIHRFRRLFLDLLLIRWRGCASTMGVITSPLSCSRPKTINLYMSTYAADEFINHFKLRNFAVFAIECFATIDRV